MDLQTLLNDGEDRAVSPVIGVILMVAITVILAAVIGTFVLNLSNQTGSTAPSASLSFEVTDTGTHPGNISIAHDQGQDLDLSQTKIIITNESSGEVFEIGPNGTEYEWSIGQELKINTTGDQQRFNGIPSRGSPGNTSDATIFRDGATGFDDADDSVAALNSTGIFEIQNGFEYTVKVIDTESEKQVSQAKVEG